MTSVILVDDDAAYRASLRSFLDASFDVRVVGEASNGPEALELVERLRPRAVVVDLAMPGVDGIELAERVREAAPETAVVLVTGIGDADERRRAERVGIGAWVPKGDPLQVENALRTLGREP